MGYGDGATGLWPTQVEDPLWSFIERLERDLTAAREYAELLERERDEALARYDARHASAIHAHNEAQEIIMGLRDALHRVQATALEAERLRHKRLYALLHEAIDCIDRPETRRRVRERMGEILEIP